MSDVVTPDRARLSPASRDEDARAVLVDQIAWGVVLAGMVLAFALQLIPTLVGPGIDAPTLDPGQGAGESPPASTLGLGAGAWFLASGLLASLAGGVAAGRLAAAAAPGAAGDAVSGIRSAIADSIPADAVPTGTQGGALALLVGTVAAWFGGRIGAVDRSRASVAPGRRSP